MLDRPLQDLDAWVLYFSNMELPVLRHTQRQLEAARENMDSVSGKDLAQIVLQDPLMAVKMLAYIQPMTTKRLHHDITTIAGAVMMLGIEPFFEHFKTLTTIEDILKTSSPQALLGVLHVIRRAQQAAQYAHDWAMWRVDHAVEEVTLAALLHDLAEILLHCFAPSLAMRIKDSLKENPGLRSAVAQREVLGVTLQQIQKSLCRTWNLPRLLLEFTDEESDRPRVKNVLLAVNLARHSANGWTDPALPDDITAIASLLNLSEEALGTRLGISLPDPEEEKEQEDQEPPAEAPPPLPPDVPKPG